MINEIIQKLATFLGITIIPDKQDVAEPQSPYATYTVLRSEFDQPHQAVRIQSESSDQMLDIKKYYRTALTVQINFYNKGTSGDIVDVIADLAQSAWIWLQEEGREEFRAYNLVLAKLSKEIDQEAEEVEKEGKHRVGFEFVLNGTREHVSQVETITSVDYNGTILK